MASQGQIPKPIITPNGGQFISEVPQPVKIERAIDDSDVKLYFSTDGSTPEKIPANEYLFPLTIRKNTIVKAIAVKEGDADSSVTTQIYNVKVASPEFNYSSGQYNAPFLLEITTETNNANIYYTTDGSTPTTNSTLYTDRIEINEDTQITAIATKINCVDSNIIQREYTIVENPTDGTGTIGNDAGDDQTGSNDNSETGPGDEEEATQGTLPLPQFNPSTFESENPITVQITMPEGSPTSRIYYTTDETEPTRESTVYSTGISIEETTMIKAFATAVNYTDSNVNTKTYTISQPPITYPFDIISNETDTSILINGSEIEDKTPYLLILTEEQLQQRVIITARKNGFVSNERYEIYIDNSFGDLRVDYFLNNETATNPNSSGESISFTLQPQLPILPPQFSDDGGAYGSPFTLSLGNPNDSNSNTFIEYAIDNDEYKTYSEPLSFTNGIYIVKARVKGSDGRTSQFISNTYVIGNKPNKPTISVEGEPNGNESVEVRIDKSDSNHIVYFTDDGINPNFDSQGNPTGRTRRYLFPLRPNKTTTIKAVSILTIGNQYLVSDVVEETVTFNLQKPQISPSNSDIYEDSVDITISHPVDGVSIYYTTDGSEPNRNSNLYNGKFTINTIGQTIVKAIAVKDGFTDSGISEKEYEIIDVPPNPTITSTGNINGSDNFLVTLSTPTTNNNFEIYYTTDGTEPIVGVNGNTNVSTKKYTTPFSIDRTTTIKAKTSLFIGNTKFDSNVSETTFEFKVSKPTFNPTGDLYEGSKEVSLSTPTPNATIYYTTDGSTPNTNSQRYGNPFTITKTGKVRAIAVRSGYTTSDVSESDYTILIPRSVAIERIAEGFLSQLDDEDLDTFRYLNHLLHLGEGDNKVITNWLGVEDEEGEQSLIIKLYEPLPTSVQENDKAWVSRLQSEPIIETVTIVGGNDEYCTPLKGPNFSIEVDNGIGFEVYNDLIASGSTTSTNLVNEYTQKLGIDTEKLSIEYVSGSQIEFKNFTHFGSAEERVKNFWYKLELIESYISTLETISNSDIDLTTIPTNTGSILITGSNAFNVSEISLSPTQRLEVDRVVENINKVVREFDGFEKFLYNDDSELAYPKTGLVLKETTENDSKNWYSNTVVAAKLFDRNNVHYINNNLPIHITTDYENEDFLLFMDMIGHHFDIIWSYINSLAKGKRLEHKVNKGITNELVYSMLESLGWDTNQSYDGKFLWEYVFGQNRDSSQKYEKTLKSANEEVWRRILNNLPYLLKHKGTKRSLSAVLATYGVPSYLLSIEEFGGPTNTEEQSMNYTFEDQTAAINFTGKESIIVSWKSINGQYPNTIELNLKFDEPQNSYLVKGGDSWDISAIHTKGSFGKIRFNISGSNRVETLETDEIRLFNDEYKQIVLTSEYGNFTFTDDIENDGGQTYDEDYTIQSFYSIAQDDISLISTANSGKQNTLYAFDLIDTNSDNFYQKFNLYVKEAKNERIRISETKLIPVDTGSQWGDPLFIEIGSASFDGKLDEFRLWKTSLTEDVINNHTLIPDAINGNSYTGSSDDLWFRLDFEHPKNRNTDTSIKNVSISSEYNQSSGSAINFDSITEYPYNYTTYTRDVTAKVPLIGNTFSNKIRFEEQELITDLSYRQRATKKSFDRAPVDSPRLGIFLSPTKELNLTMLRSFGEFNIDNYIGNPSDRYSDTYTELKDVRDYFFQRITRNFNEYIQLVRYINKSLFKDLENLIPSRAKVSKGLLIEPHLLERSKVRWNKPQSERNDYETSINVDETNTIELEYGGYEGETSINDDIEFQTEYFYEETNIEYQKPQLDVEESSIETNIEYQKPELVVEESSIETNIEYENPELNSTYHSLETLIDYDSEAELNSTYDSLETLIDYDLETELSGENLGYELQISAPIGTTIQTNIDITDFSQIGFDLETGFGLYASASYGKVTTLDIFGNETSSRQEIYLVKEKYIEKVEEQIDGWPKNSNSVIPSFELVDKERIRYKITKIPFGGSEPTVGGNILEVTPLNGYFPSHYKFKNNLSEGLRRSFFKGSTQTESTTPDGLPPVEILTTNPNILRVADTGRGSGEPILIVD